MKRVIVALPGSSVQTTDPSKEALDSLYPNPKIDSLASPQHAGIINVNWSSTNITVPLTGTKEMYTFQHNYGYIPTVFGSYSFDNFTGTIKNGTLPLQIGALGIIIIDADGLYIRLRWFSFDIGSPLTAIPPFAMQVRFYVMAERGYDT